MTPNPMRSYVAGLGAGVLTEEQREELQRYAADNMGSMFHDVMAYLMGRTMRFVVENAALGRLSHLQAEVLTERTTNLNERLKTLEAQR